MWFDYGMQKINIAGPGEAGYQSCQTLANGGTCQKVFLASSHTTSTAQFREQPSRHQE